MLVVSIFESGEAARIAVGMAIAIQRIGVATTTLFATDMLNELRAQLPQQSQSKG